MCEAEERNQKALFILENEWGSGRIDIGLMKSTLRGRECDDHQCECRKQAAA